MGPDRMLVNFKIPFGRAGAAATEQGICCVVLPKKDRKAVERELNRVKCPRLRLSRTGVRSAARNDVADFIVLKKAEKLLQRYFSGERVVFDLPLDVRHYTPFQRTVWRATAEIPYGETRSYAWIARRIKKPRAARAVGRAMGANPIPIIIP